MDECSICRNRHSEPGNPKYCKLFLVARALAIISGVKKK